MTDTKEASEKLVRDFLGSWEGRDLEPSAAPSPTTPFTTTCR